MLSTEKCHFQRLITHKWGIFLFVDILCFFIIFFITERHRVTRERVHMFPKKIWGQRSFRGHLRSLNFNSQDMHYWLLHQHTALYSLQMYWVYWVGLVSKNIRTFWVLVSVMAFQQCQKLLKMHFCKFILYPLKRALLGLQNG